MQEGDKAGALREAPQTRLPPSPRPPPRRRGALSLLPQGGSSGSHEELGNHPIAGPLCPNLVEIGGVQRASWHTAFS